ncbi:MAG: efflux RND transporter periplasmic adaptor subunit [Acidobacteriota bacterium]
MDPLSGSGAEATAPSSKRKALLIGGVALLLVGLVVASIVSSSRRGKGVAIYAEEAKRRDISRIVKASGQVDPRTKVNISAHVVGKIERLYVKEGDWIDKGKPFLDLEKEAFVALRDSSLAQLEIQRSRLRQAELALADAQIKKTRAERLIDEKIATKEQLETASLNWDSTRQSLEQAKEGVTQVTAELAKAKSDLEKTTIFAPISGRVITLNAKEGEVVVSGTMNNPASVIGIIADLSEILVEVDVDETEIVHVKVGQKAELDVDAVPDHKYAGTVVEIGSSGYSKATQPDVTFFKVKILFDAPDDSLRPGMSSRAAIDTAKSVKALVIPIQAVVERTPVHPKGAAKPAEPEAEIRVIFKVVKDKAVQTVVQTGLVDATGIEVTGGLADGDKVITGPYRSLKKIKDGDAITITKEADDKDAQKEKAEKDGKN